MGIQDEIAITNKRHWENAVKEGAGCTRPQLDLDVQAYRAYREGVTTTLPAMRPPCHGSADRMVMADVRGKDVLCLAAGGGQQSAVFSLLGARVTVFDFAEGQLDGDRKAARHYGYEVTTIQGDMRDLSSLDDKSFDIVYGTGMAFVPNAREVYKGVARVLRTGGLYRVNFTNPAVEFMDWRSWDGVGYRITVPYDERVERPEKEGDAIQFRHYMNDIFNGLLAQGFSIQHIEDGFLDVPDLDAPPGTYEHWLAYMPRFVIVARKE
jgi:ubiquinone/menaquinone biosynthesis C-methylase UbiE